MKKSLIVLLSVSLLLPVTVLAYTAPPEPGGGVTIVSVTAGVADAVWKVFALIALVMFVVSGILFLTAQGDPGKIKIAKDSFIWGVAGVVVAILAYSIIALVTELLKGSSTGGK